MQENDIRHQKYLEPIIRFLEKDLRMVLDPEYPEELKKHRLSGALLMLKNTVKELDEVVKAENQKNADGLAAAIARVYEDNVRDSAALMQRVLEDKLTEMDEARLASFTEKTPSTEAWLDQNFPIEVG